MTTICVPSDEAIELLQPPDGVDVVVWDGSAERPPNLDDVEFLVGRPGAPAVGTLDGLPRLQVVQLLLSGVDPWLPIVPPGVQLCSGRGAHGTSTAEIAVAGVLSMVRRLPVFRERQEARQWAPEQTDGLDETRVLILGAGDIAAHVATALRVFGADIVMVGRTARPGVSGVDELPALLPEAKIVVLALSATAESHGLVDKQFLAALPDGAILVNVARGTIVDTDSLLAELEACRLYAFLDVTDPEPLPDDHPLWTAPNLLITPHIGGRTNGWQNRAYRLVRGQLERYLAGEPLQNQIVRNS